MIIARSPLRISLGGGGTDLASYYRDHEGFLIAAAIDKYVYVTCMRPFKKGLYLKYSQLEKVNKVSEISHPIIRETLNEFNSNESQIEITTLADIPSGTGLGSSGSFTTALLKALYSHQKKLIKPEELAELACHIEIDRLGQPIGKQDQYAATYGGIKAFKFNKDDTVTVKSLSIDKDTLLDLENNLLLFFTGFSRRSGSILKDQKERTEKNDNVMINNLHYVKELGHKSKKALEKGDTELFGKLLHEHWEHKKNRSSGMSNLEIDNWYDTAMKNGAIGGKVVGAGGGGFLMFYASDRNKLRRAMSNAGLEEVRFGFDYEGTKIVMT